MYCERARQLEIAVVNRSLVFHNARSGFANRCGGVNFRVPHLLFWQ